MSDFIRDPRHVDAAHNFLRIAAERIEEAERARDHFIFLGREYGLTWEEIAADVQLSVSTCRRLCEGYLLATRAGAAA